MSGSRELHFTFALQASGMNLGTPRFPGRSWQVSPLALRRSFGQQ